MESINTSAFAAIGGIATESASHGCAGGWRRHWAVGSQIFGSQDRGESFGKLAPGRADQTRFAAQRFGQ